MDWSRVRGAGDPQRWDLRVKAGRIFLEYAFLGVYAELWPKHAFCVFRNPTSFPNQRHGCFMLLFRKSALKRLQSPTRLDELLQTTTPRNRWALAALGALVIAALLWGIFGSVDTTVSSQGILIREGGTFNISAQGDGTVAELPLAGYDLQVLEVHQPVTAGQVVARISNPQLEAEVNGARSEAKRLRQDYEDLVGRYADDDKLYAATVASVRANDRKTLEARRKRLEAVEK